MDKQAFEQTGLIPRSIIRTFERFKQQLLPGSANLVIQEFRISRYQVLVSIKCLFILIFLPLIISFLLKYFIITPLTKYFWNNYQNDIFINSYQQKLAFHEMKNFEEQIFFESLLEDNLNTLNLDKKNFLFHQKFQEKIMSLAEEYNKESIEAISNIFSDFVMFGTLFFLFKWMKPQIIILKSFLTESIYSLSDTTKSFLLILFTDLLVGFHSPRGWEFFLGLLLQHFGLPENQEFILLFVATFPVLLDTVFKYWIFRYLNKISPSTVATYHNMIE
jgi:hypothetical protein